MQNKALVRCEGVTKTFFGKSFTLEVLKGIDLEIHPKEIVALLGPSGSGKTTLISILSSFLRPDLGRVFLLGQEIAVLDDREISSFRAKNIGFMYQNFFLIPYLTVYENVQIPLLLRGMGELELKNKIKDLLHEIGMLDKMFSYPKTLSGGEQQRIALVRAIIGKPKVLFCDEPTSALDHESALKELSMLRVLTKKFQLATVIVTHDEKVYPFVDRLLKIERGKVEEITLSKQKQNSIEVRRP